MNPTPFPELDEVLDRFVRRVRLILGSNLVGVYLTGAFALGEGDGASDRDFLVVTEQEVTDGGEHELRRLHRDVFEWPGYWAHNLEGSYAVPAERLRVSAPSRIDGFLEDLRGWAPFDGSWTQRYAVESMSRMLCTLEGGEVVGKRTGLDWAETSMPPEWRDLIQQVRRAWSEFAWNDPPRPGSMERSLAFAEYGRKRARTT